MTVCTVAVVSMLWGLAGPAALTSRPAPPPSTTSTLAAKTSTPSWARVPTRPLTRPSWWRTPLLRQWAVEDVFVGVQRAIARIDIGDVDLWLATQADGQVQGPLHMPPDAKWVGFGDGDVVYVADAKGQFFRSTLSALLQKTPAVLDVLDDVDAWDAGGQTVAALHSRDGAVFISADGGNSFATVAFDDRPRRLAVRADGVVVVAGRALHVSKDGGQTWSTTQITLRRLRRQGQFIGGQNGRCEQGTLAEDGVTWVPYVVPPSLSSWRSPFAADVATAGYRRAPNVADQRHPVAPKAEGPLAIDVVRECRSRSPSSGLGGGGIGRVGRGPPKRDPCSVAKCLQAPSTATHLRTLGNGVCGQAQETPLLTRFVPSARRAAPLRHLHTTAAACQRSGLASAGQLVVQRPNNTVSLLDAPCAATRVVGQNGLHVVLCEESTRAGVVDVQAERDGQFVSEVKLQGQVRFADFADVVDGRRRTAQDGTLVFEVDHDGQRTAWVRAPVDVGTDDAWHHVVVDGALAHRALSDGRVLVLAASDVVHLDEVQVSSTPAEVTSSDTSNPPQLLWAPGEFNNALHDIEVCHGPLLSADPSLRGVVDVELQVTPEGALTVHLPDAVDPRVRACFEQTFAKQRFYVVDRVQRRRLAARLQMRVTVDADNHAVDVWVVGRRAKERIAHGVFIGSTVRDMRVVEGGWVEFDVGGPRAAVWRRVPRQGPLPSDHGVATEGKRRRR